MYIKYYPTSLTKSHTLLPQYNNPSSIPIKIMTSTLENQAPISHSLQHLPYPTSARTQPLQQLNAVATTIPNIHGIVPKSPHSTKTHDIHTPSRRKSTYPRPSPPAFWYTDRIVPLPAPPPRLQGPMPPSPPTPHPTLNPGIQSSETRGNVLWYLPYGLEVLIFTSLAVGVCVWGVVMLLNFRPGGWNWTCNGMGGWRREGRGRTGVERKKVGYESECEGEESLLLQDMSTSVRQKDTCTNDEKEEEDEDEDCISILPARQLRHSSKSAKHGYAPHFSTPTNLKTKTNTNANPAFHPRSSSEWLAEREAFFTEIPSKTTTTVNNSSSSSVDPNIHQPPSSNPIFSSQSTSASASTSESEENILCTLEEGITPCSDMQRSHLSVTAEKMASRTWLDRSLDFLDQGLDDVIESLVRWMNDDDEEGEGELLPMNRS